MNLTKEELALVERRRARERQKRGMVTCFDCGGMGCFQHSFCDTCNCSGELKRGGAAIARQVAYLLKCKANAMAAWDLRIKQTKEGPK